MHAGYDLDVQVRTTWYELEQTSIQAHSSSN